MKINRPSGHRGFTLIELLAVITIIVILAGLVVGGMGYVNEKQSRSKAQTQIALLSKAIEAYKLDMGYYPTSSAPKTDGTDNSATILYTKLFYEGWQFVDSGNAGTSTTDPPATQIYMAELDPRSTKQGWIDTVKDAKPTAPRAGTTTPNTKIKDPWGNEYRYRPAKKLNGDTVTETINPDYDLWSVGKNGKTDAGNSAGSIGAEVNRDDIRNF